MTIELRHHIYQSAQPYAGIGQTQSLARTQDDFCGSLITCVINGGQCLAWYCLLFFSSRSRVALRYSEKRLQQEKLKSSFQVFGRRKPRAQELRVCVKASDWMANKCKSTSSERGARVCILVSIGRTTNNMKVWNESRACCTVGRLLTRAQTAARSHSTSLRLAENC